MATHAAAVYLAQWLQTAAILVETGHIDREPAHVIRTAARGAQYLERVPQGPIELLDEARLNYPSGIIARSDRR